MPPARADLPLRKLSTRIVRIPRVDWPRIVTGQKSELRLAGRWAPDTWKMETPLPIVGYSFQRFRAEADQALLVVERAWREPLGAITPGSLAAEGFATLADFKLYWKQRHASVGFRPLTEVHVLQLRPWVDEDRDAMAALLLERLYGRWL